jgi:phosphoribosylformylglycinamidine synthase
MGAEVSFLWHKDSDLKNVDAVIVPGGFSYGDYLRCGAIARFSPIMNEVSKFAAKGGKVLGICNGFQILQEAHLLPGAMLQNRDLRFICKNVHLKVESTSNDFTAGLSKADILTIPVAHGEGNFFIDQDGLKSLQDNEQIAFTYSNANGDVNEETNINGSVANIAGITNKEGNVLGMMPHPERAMEANLGSEDGIKIFHSLLNQLSLV